MTWHSLFMRPIIINCIGTIVSIICRVLYVFLYASNLLTDNYAFIHLSPCINFWLVFNPCTHYKFIPDTQLFSFMKVVKLKRIYFSFIHSCIHSDPLAVLRLDNRLLITYFITFKGHL